MPKQRIKDLEEEVKMLRSETALLREGNDLLREQLALFEGSGLYDETIIKIAHVLPVPDPWTAADVEE